MTDWYSSSSKGAASELAACVYFLKQGCHVFRSESPSCPFDLVIQRDGSLLRVEIKSVTWVPINDKYNIRAPSPTITWPTNDEWDILVVVDHENSACFELITHDKVEGRAQVRAFCGLAPLPATIGSKIDPKLCEILESSPEQCFSCVELMQLVGCVRHRIDMSMNRLCASGLVTKVRPATYKWNTELN